MPGLQVRGGDLLRTTDSSRTAAAARSGSPCGVLMERLPLGVLYAIWGGTAAALLAAIDWFWRGQRMHWTGYLRLALVALGHHHDLSGRADVTHGGDRTLRRWAWVYLGAAIVLELIGIATRSGPSP